jgi:hypothetical protein
MSSDQLSRMEGRNGERDSRDALVMSSCLLV